MRAIRFDNVGGPEVMRLVDVDLPPPGAGELRLKQAAIAINFIDTYHRSGLYPMKLPSGLGLEAVGVVEAVGAGVTDFAAGDRAGYCTGPVGAYAEAHNVPAGRAVKIPDAISDDIAASVLMKGMTSEYLLRRTYPVKEGETILFHAAAGGVGQVACQWARALGATVIGTVGSDAKVELAKSNGCDHVIVSSREDIAARVMEITGGKGVAVSYDGVGKESWDASLASLSLRGVQVSFGNASGPVPPVSPAVLSPKSLYLTRPGLFSYTSTTEELRMSAAVLFDVMLSGNVKIAPPTVYTLADAAKAHADLEGRRTTGSLILKP